MADRSCIKIGSNATEGCNVGSGVGVYKNKLDLNTLSFKSLSPLGDNIRITCDDNNIYISGESGGGSGTSYTFQQSLNESSGNVNLVNDETTPGNSKYYGTDSGGTKGFFNVPNISNITVENGLTKNGNTISLGGDLTGNTDISGTDTLTISAPHIASDIQSFTFNNSPSIGAYAEGRLYYDNCALNFDREVSGVTLQIGEEQVVRVTNVTGSLIENGSAVYMLSASNDVPTIVKSIASNYTGAKTIGILTQDIANNNEGYVTTQGIVHNIDLSTGGWIVGDTAWLSDTVAGGFSRTRPDYPNYSVVLGTVTKIGVTGSIFVTVGYIADHVSTEDFTGYTASTETKIDDKLEITDFNTYTGNTDTRFTDIEDVTDIALTGATNGLCLNGRDVYLGGALTEVTTISGAYNLIIAPTCDISIRGTSNDVNIDGQTNALVALKSQSGTLTSASSFTNAVGFYVDFDNGFKVYDNRSGSTKTGIEYNEDYSSCYSNRSLVDKEYVDTVATGRATKESVLVATTGNSTMNGLLTIDGVTLSLNDRVLVKNQTDATENGIYAVSSGNWSRTSDYDFNPTGEVANGDIIPVISGDTNANSQWVMTSSDPVSSGDDIDFSLFGKLLEISDGDGVCFSSNAGKTVINVDLLNSGSALSFSGSKLTVDGSIAGSGLTMSSGILAVNASTTPATGSEIAVRFGTNDCLFVDGADFSYTTAANGLCKSGCNVVLGGSLTGDTEIDGVSNTYDLCLTDLKGFILGFSGGTVTDDSGDGYGLQYSTDYCGSFQDNSLVSKCYVDGKVNSGVLADNGLTKVGDTVIWGGELTGDTFILRDTSNFCIKDTGIETIADCSCSYVQPTSIDNYTCDSSGCISRIEMCNDGTISIIANNADTGLTITSAGAGMVYASDYSSNFAPRSLVDKEYVDNEITGATANIDLQDVTDNDCATTNSMIIGDVTSEATGTTSFSQGFGNKAYGDYSHAEGSGTKAISDYSHVSGKYNIGYSTTITEIGVGADDSNRCNAFEVYCNGQIALPRLTGRTSETCVVYIDNTGKLTHGTVSGSTVSGVTSVNSGDGMDFTDITTTGSVVLGTPSTLTLTTTNTVGTNTHCHNLSIAAFTASANGLVPSPGTASGKFLKDDGTWADAGSGSGGVGTLQQVTDSGCTTTNPMVIGNVGSTATGLNSLAQGNNVKAHGNYSHAEGALSEACANNSHAEGYSSIATGSSSHAEGCGTCAGGIASHAEGCSTCANGSASHAEGLCTCADGANSHASGMYNIGCNDTIAEIGVGADGSNRCNAFEVYCNGQIAMPKLNAKSSETCVVYIDNTGKLTHGTVSGGSTGGGVGTLQQVTDSGCTTTNSMVIGDSGSQATGTTSFANGSNACAWGNYSHAEGQYARALGDYSHAEGRFLFACGYGSHAEGQNTRAIGMSSHAEGYYADACGNNSHAEGRQTYTCGNYSHSEGYHTCATGQSSHAEGECTVTYGNHSHAEGDHSKAYAEHSHAEGINTYACGLGSHSEGGYTCAFGVCSHAEGSGTKACGDFSHAEGYNTLVTGGSSHAEGYYTCAFGNYSHAEGDSTYACGNSSHAEGVCSCAIGNNSHTEGSHTSAIADNSHAEGQFSVTNGTYSHAEGNGRTYAIYSHAEGIGRTYGDCSHAEGCYACSYGSNSHAEGHRTVTSGDSSHSEGNCTCAFGVCSHAEGDHTIASGITSHAEGCCSCAIGNVSHAEGYWTFACANNSHASGMYNIGCTTTIAEIGIGSGNIYRCNAFEVCTDGNAKILGTLTVTDVTCTSDSRLKCCVTPITNALSNINNLSGVEHQFICKDCKCHYGLIAQDVEYVLPYSVSKVSTDPSEKTLINDDMKYTIDYASIVPVLIESIKELSNKVKILEEKIK